MKFVEHLFAKIKQANPVRARERWRSRTSLRAGSGSNGMNIIGRRKVWYLISASVLVPAAIAIAVFGLKLGVDFTGGTTLEVSGRLSPAQLEEIIGRQGARDISITNAQSGHLLVRFRNPEGSATTQQQLEPLLKKQGAKVERFDQIGPSVSRDLLRSAIWAISLMSLAIAGYITWAFRKVPKELKPYKFGLATLLAAFAHDALFIIGIFAILGRILSVEVDSYIVTALLTVIGFSIHDTIVVFDRIREKLVKSRGSYHFSELVNQSLNETIVRSLNTSLVIILVLLSLFLFGGASIRYFILALLLGMVAGTYSSIFIAAPLLVSWQGKAKR